MITVFPPRVASAVTGITYGYNGYAWTPNPSDSYPLQLGSIDGYAGHPVIYPTGTAVAAVVNRVGLIRQPAGQATGNIRLSGSMIDMGGSGVGHIALGLTTGVATNSNSWSEGVSVVYDAGANTAQCFTSTASGIAIPAYASGGTQRGSTVTGLTAAVAHPFNVTVSASGNVTFDLDGVTVFDGAGGVDLLGPAGNTVLSVGITATTSSSSVGWTSLAVTYP